MKEIKYWLAVTAILWGCSDHEKYPIKKADELFKAGDYEAAKELYISVIDEKGSEAQVGAGWCAFKLKSYAQADSFFAVSAKDTLPDGYAGWSFTSWYMKDFQEAIDRAGVVLQKQPSYIFSLDTRIRHTHLLWIQAESHLELDHIPECIYTLRLLDAAFTADANDPNIRNILLAKLQTYSAVQPD